MEEGHVSKADYDAALQWQADNKEEALEAQRAAYEAHLVAVEKESALAIE